MPIAPPSQLVPPTQLASSSANSVVKPSTGISDAGLNTEMQNMLKGYMGIGGMAGNMTPEMIQRLMQMGMQMPGPPGKMEQHPFAPPPPSMMNPYPMMPGMPGSGKAGIIPPQPGLGGIPKDYPADLLPKATGAGHANIPGHHLPPGLDPTGIAGRAKSGLDELGVKVSKPASSGLMDALTGVIEKAQTEKTKSKTDAEKALEQVKNEQVAKLIQREKEKERIAKEKSTAAAKALAEKKAKTANIPSGNSTVPTGNESGKAGEKKKTLLEGELTKDDTPISDLLKSTPTPGMGTAPFNWKKKYMQQKEAAGKTGNAGKTTISPDKSADKIQSSPTVSKTSVGGNVGVAAHKSVLAQKLPSAEEPVPVPLNTIVDNAQMEKKKREREEKKRRRKDQKEKDRKRKWRREQAESEGPSLPPDPGYIPKVRITTFRSMQGGTLFSSNQFKPGEERATRTRSTRRKKDWESTTIDLSEFQNWESTHKNRKHKRKRAQMGLPSDEETFQQEQVRKHNEERRRQEQLEKEPVKLEDETAQDVSHHRGCTEKHGCRKTGKC